jgi:O-antigen/teichoic acid export membrane protein
MSAVQRIARNTTLLLLSNVASFVLGFFFTMYVARHLAAEGFGVLSLATALTAIVGVFADFGLQMLMTRDIARDRSLAQKYLGNIAIIKILLSIITFGLIALTVKLMGYPFDTVRVVYFIGLSVVFNALGLMFYGVFRAYERMEFEALGLVLNGALTLAGAFYGISHGFSVVGFALIYLIASLITLGYSFVISIWRFAVPKIEVDLQFWKEALKQAWPFGLGLLLASVYAWIGAVMLSRMKGDEAVGLYTAAYRLVYMLQFIPLAYFSAVFPSMSRFHVTSKEFLRFTYERSFKYMLMIGIPIGVGTTVLGGKLILLIFGGEYYQSIILLQILGWSVAFLFVNGVFGSLFQSINRQMVALAIIAATTGLNVVLNIILIPRYGTTGASVALLAAAFSGFVISFVWSSRTGYGIPIKSLFNILAKVSFASAVMFVFIFYLAGFYILALVPLAALLYFIVLLIIRGIDEEDLSLLRSVFVRRKAAIDEEKNDIR